MAGQAAPAINDQVALSIVPSSASTSSAPQLPQTRENFLKYGVKLYQAALQGNWAAADQIIKQAPDWIRQPIAKGGERVLHIAAAAKHTYFVKELIELMTQDDLAICNDAGNTAFCLAATSGVVDIASMMVEKNSALPNIRGSQEMTPLRMAVLLGHRKMVWYLLSVTDDQQLTDEERIAILTSSIDTNLYDVGKHMLDKHRELAILRDPYRNNETALHVLARKPLKSGIYHQQNIWKKLLWLGCYCCAVMSGGKLAIGKNQEQPVQLQLVKNLWEEIIKQGEREVSQLIGAPWRLLFVAAQCGNVEFLITLIRSYPDLIWKVDEENRSIFHIAVINRHERIFKLIHEIGAIKDLIAVDKDKRDNNMLHLAGVLAPSHRLNCVSGAALQMQRELLWFKAVEKVVRPEYAEAENMDKKTPSALFTEQHEELRVKGEEWMKKTAESCALVATLIATVVFTAAFTLPGGTDSGTGAPILVSRPLFLVFSIFNAISLVTSSASILVFLSILTSRYAEHDFLRSLPLKLMLGLTGLFVSIATMMVAFTATFFITFRKGAQWIPIPIAIFASVPVILFAFLQYPLLRDIYRSTYRSRSIFQPTQPKLFQNFSFEVKNNGKYMTLKP